MRVSVFLAGLASAGCSRRRRSRGCGDHGRPGTGRPEVAVPSPDDAKVPPAPDADRRRRTDVERSARDAKMGATVHAGGVSFRVWAPTRRACRSPAISTVGTPAAQPARTKDRRHVRRQLRRRARGTGLRVRESPLPPPKQRPKPNPRARKVKGSRGVSVIVNPAAFAWKSNDFRLRRSRRSRPTRCTSAPSTMRPVARRARG